MRRRDCLAAQRASSLISAWAGAHVGGCRHASTFNSPTDTTTNNAPTQESTKNSTINDVSSASAVAAAKAPAPPTSEASVAEATGRLRAALRVLSVIEQAKSDQSKRKHTHTMEEARPLVSPSAETQDESRGSSAPSAAAAAGKENCTPAGAVGAANTSAVSWASATSSWIRNKRPKFWALVNDAGADGTGEAPGAGTGSDVAPRRHEEKREEAEHMGATTAAPLPSSPPKRATTTHNKAHPTPARPSSSSQTPSISSGQAKATSFRDNEAAAPDAWSFSPSLSPSPLAPNGDATTSHFPSSPDASSSDASARSAPVSADSIRATNSVPPFRSRYKKDVAHALSELLNRDAALGPQLLGQLSAESRRLMLIMGTASEYFGVDYGEVAEQIKEADTDRDNSISSKEFDAWVGHMAGMASNRRHDTPMKSPLKASLSPPPPALPSPLPSTTAAAVSAHVDTAGAAAVSTGAAPAASSPPLPSPSSTHSSETSADAVTQSSGSSPHSMAPSATLSRQRAEMAISTARAASARIIEVMQKNVAPLSSKSTPPPSSPRDTSQMSQPKPQSPPVAKAVPAALPSTPAPTVEEAPASAKVESTSAASSTDSKAPATPPAAAAKAKKGEPAFIPWPTFARIVLAAAPPFLAFGMLDNCTLVLAGGAIDNALSAKLGLTQMAAAGMGGVVSGVAGIQVHGLAERFTRAKPPMLTPEQERSDTFLRAENVGNTLGMVVGLVIGMLPLLFMGRSSQASEKEEAEHKRFREEAKRSHQRRCTHEAKIEAQERLALVKEERAAWEAIVKAYAVKPPLPA